MPGRLNNPSARKFRDSTVLPLIHGGRKCFLRRLFRQIEVADDADQRGDDPPPIRVIDSFHGRKLVTDGPFAETREQLGGYFLVEAKDLDCAINIASRIPGVNRGTVEIRPVIEIPDLPTNEK